MVHKIPCEDDEVPQDLNAFFGHPLNSGFQNDDGGATALLHEYHSLPAIDKTCEDSFSNDSHECADNQEMKKLSEYDCIFSIKSELSTDGSELLAPEEANDSSQHQESFDMFVEELCSQRRDDSTADCMSNSEHQKRNVEEALGSEILDEMLEAGADIVDTVDLLDGYLHCPSPIDLSTSDFNNNDSQSPLLADQNAKLKSSDDKLTSSVSTSHVKLENEETRLTCELSNNLNSVTPLKTVASKNKSKSASSSQIPQLQRRVSEQLQMHRNLTRNTMSHPDHPQPQQMGAHSNAIVDPNRLPFVVRTSDSGLLQAMPVIGGDGQEVTYHMTPYYPPSHVPQPILQPLFNSYNMYYDPTMGAAPMLPHPAYYNQHGNYRMFPQHFHMPCHPMQASNQHILGSHFVRPRFVVPSTFDSPPPYNSDRKLQTRTKCDSDDMAMRSGGGSPVMYNVKSDDTLQKACSLADIKQTLSCEDNVYLKIPPTPHLKSPDSGFGESNLETAPCSIQSEVSNPSSPLTEPHGVKRRRGSTCILSRQSGNKQSNSASSNIEFPKREADTTGYEMRLEAPTSCGAKIEDDRMTYLNKGQFYNLVLENKLPPSKLRSTFVKTVITLRFRDDCTEDAALKYWQFWHAQQPVERRVKAVELDEQAAEGIVCGTLESVAINSVTFAWDPHETVKVPIAVHCLSTDFSGQKGVKGLPLHIQIDTYDGIFGHSSCPVHRAYAQIKTFCEKGAERKARDEEKRKEKACKPADSTGQKHMDFYHPVEMHTEFYSMSDLSTEVYLYTGQKNIMCEYDDTPPFQDFMVTREPSNSDDMMTSLSDAEFMCSPNSKRARVCEAFRVLVYVKQPEDTAFTPLLLNTPTTEEFSLLIMKHFPHITNIRMAYKRDNKGRLVKLNDDLVKCFKSESSFEIEFEEHPEKGWDITLNESDH